DEIRVEVDRVAEALAARARTVRIVEGEEARFRFAIGAMAGGALKRRGKTQLCRCLVVIARHGVKLNLAGFAVAGLNRIDDSCARVGRDGKTIDEDEDRLR